MILVDAVTRLQPGAIGDKDSVLQDSFSNGLLHWPEYTKPKVFNNRSVPSVLLSGDHKAIQEWRVSRRVWSTQ